MILNAIAEKLKRQSKDDFKGRHFEAWLIVQAVAWYLRYPLSYRDLEEMFRERGFEVDHSTINRWVLAYAPMIEKRLRQFRRPQLLPPIALRRAANALSIIAGYRLVALSLIGSRWPSASPLC